MWGFGADHRRASRPADHGWGSTRASSTVVADRRATSAVGGAPRRSSRLRRLAVAERDHAPGSGRAGTCASTTRPRDVAACRDRARTPSGADRDRGRRRTPLSRSSRGTGPRTRSRARARRSAGVADLLDASRVHDATRSRERERLVVVVGDEQHRQAELGRRARRSSRDEALAQLAVERPSGSSSIRSARRRARVRAASATRCCSPPESSPTAPALEAREADERRAVSAAPRARRRARARRACAARTPRCRARRGAGTSAWSWNIKPERRGAGATPARSTPSQRTVPRPRGSSPAIARSSVLLPLPLGPRTPRPRRPPTVRSTPSTRDASP